jgi:cytochrome c556
MHPVMRFSAAVVAALLAAISISGCAQSAFCDSIGVGLSATAALRDYLKACGDSYKISRGPFDADKETTGYASYARVVEWSLDVRENSEGSIAFLLVGERTPHGRWRTLGRPGTGP